MRISKLDSLLHANPRNAVYYPAGWETYDGVAITGYITIRHGEKDIMPHVAAFGWTGMMHKGVYIPPGMC